MMLIEPDLRNPVMPLPFELAPHRSYTVGQDIRDIAGNRYGYVGRVPVVGYFRDDEGNEYETANPWIPDVNGWARKVG
jgi:hypothetical protein